MKTILLVCTGNTCRSSMAEALLTSILKEMGVEADYRVKSAGTAAFSGDKASINAIKALEEKGMDLTGHRSTPITIDVIEEADLILTMTQGHKAGVINFVPTSKEKVFTLKEFGYKDGPEKIDSYDISDPFGYAIEVYRGCRDEIEEALRRAVDRLMSND